MKAFVIVPTLQAAGDWSRFVTPLLAALPPEQVLIVDSSSTDGTEKLAREAGFRVHTIARSEFDHGGTRKLASELLPDAEILVYMTQDAVLESPHSLSFLLQAFHDPTVAAAYGRQLPRPNANPIETHARLFNYPSQSSTCGLGCRKQLGFKTIFISNSFAAYRRSALLSVGNFPRNVIFGEDTITAARLLLADWKIKYISEATVFHSHGYTLIQEFKRYFDIGVLHRNESWLLSEFGNVGGEGRRFVMSEFEYLWPQHWRYIPYALMRSMFKLIGYRLGRNENKLNIRLKRSLSMHSSFWQ